MQKRNVLNSSRLLELKKQRRKVVIDKILILFFGIVVILILLAYLSRINTLNISKVEVSGNQVVDTNAIQAVATEQMSGKYLWIFPKTNVFLYPKNAIINQLQGKFKRLEDINLSIKNNKTLEISLAERKALYTWCGITPPDATVVTTPPSTTDCYFVDENGYIFDKAPYFSGDVYFKFYGSPDVGQQEFSSCGASLDPSGCYFSKNYIKQLVSFRDILVGFDLKPVAMYVTNDGDVQVFLSKGNSSAIGPQIIFKINDDYQNVAENLEAALTTDPLKTEFKNKYSSLLYIDLRFGNKVYYKFATPQAPVATK
jgi:hypothetical protein